MTISDFLAHLFKFDPLDIINAILVPGSIGILLSFALSRYLTFTQAINAACAEVHRLNMLQYSVDDIGKQVGLIREVSYRITGIGFALRAEGHVQASNEIRKIVEFYRDLLIDAAEKFPETESEKCILWTREIFTNYAARLLALNPNYAALFDFRRFYSDVAITKDVPIDEFKGPEKLDVRNREL